MHLTEPMKFLNDGKATISVVHNPVQHYQMKRVRIDKNFIRSWTEREIIILSYVPTKSQDAKILTKALPKLFFDLCFSKLEMIDIYSRTWRRVLEILMKSLDFGEEKIISYFLMCKPDYLFLFKFDNIYAHYKYKKLDSYKYNIILIV